MTPSRQRLSLDGREVEYFHTLAHYHRLKDLSSQK